MHHIYDPYTPHDPVTSPVATGTAGSNPLEQYEKLAHGSRLYANAERAVSRLALDIGMNPNSSIYHKVTVSAAFSDEVDRSSAVNALYSALYIAEEHGRAIRELQRAGLYDGNRSGPEAAAWVRWAVHWRRKLIAHVEGGRE